jgi:hypothetical protein
MKSLLRLLRPGRSGYRSTLRCASNVRPGVRFEIRRMSLARRIELAQGIRELAQRLEFHQAGETVHEQVEAAAISAGIERVYLEWGLVRVDGLRIDGERATAGTLYSAGPEELTREIVNRIKGECGLTDDERKN